MKLVADRTDELVNENITPRPLSTYGLGRKVYTSSLIDPDSKDTLRRSRRLLTTLLNDIDIHQCDLPSDLQRLGEWVENSATRVANQYRAYLDARKRGQPRAYFSTKGHALYFLRCVAPTKLVDGAWLYGTVRHWQHSRYWSLLHTYMEELGGGEAAQNHVHLYRQLLLAEGCDGGLQDLDDRYFLQGAVQLALGYNSDEYLPEVIGYNLGYEQLPLHLLITAYELTELGIDPYYFTLHVTIDNASSGHARRAVQAVLENLPAGDRGDYYRRVKQGYLLNDVGVGSLEIIEAFDHHEEVVRTVQAKSHLAQLHSDYKKIQGLSVNEWLADPEQAPQFLRALMERGWIRLDQDPEASPFWGLLEGPRACMKGVFNAYELRIIYEWIAGSWLRDDVLETGRSFTGGSSTDGSSTDDPSKAVNLVQGHVNDPPERRHSPDGTPCDSLGDPHDKVRRWIACMAPGRHDAPEGLSATRHFYRFFRTSGA